MLIVHSFLFCVVMCPLCIAFLLCVGKEQISSLLIFNSFSSIIHLFCHSVNGFTLKKLWIGFHIGLI